jgi:hypothetical protein
VTPFYLDEDISYEVANIAARLGLDVTASRDAGNNGRTDEEQLDYAASQGRCLVTGNCSDFARLTREFSLAGRPHGGVLCVPPTWRRQEYARIARALAEFAKVRGEDSTAYLFDYLS